jgi:hypothetical protein
MCENWLPREEDNIAVVDFEYGEKILVYFLPVFEIEGCDALAQCKPGNLCCDDELAMAKVCR